MLIDDDPISNMVSSLLLKRYGGATVSHEFTDAEKALEVFKAAAETGGVVLPDVVLLDLNMPIMDGWAFLDQFGGLAHQLPTLPAIYILTSSSLKADTDRAQKYPQVKNFLTKPLTDAVVKDLIAQYSLQTEEQ